jgi:ATP-binding protein involved in chromosome partitioning
MAAQFGIDVIGQIPLVQSIREGGDEGTPIALQAGHPAAEAFEKIASRLVD